MNASSIVDTTFGSLPPEAQAAIREKQRAAKARKQAGKKEAATSSSAAAATKGGAAGDYPDKISSEEYFRACPASLFYDPSLKASEKNLDLVMGLVDADAVVGRSRTGSELRLSQFQYFVFGGSATEIWDPTFNARLAFEGFFTITTDHGPHGGNEPLPELQPFYGVIDWVNFNDSRHVKKSLNRLRKQTSALRGASAQEVEPIEGAGSETSSSTCSYFMYHNVDVDATHDALDAYQKRRHGGVNWLTKKYLHTMKAASADPHTSFRIHSIELYDGPLGADGPRAGHRPRMLAGEIGFSIGRVYTSLSGFYDLPGAGNIQLVCLGKWLEHKGYAFWSMGHCYSPEMEYKRQLGHRIYPRADFLRRLRQHRGAFRVRDAGPERLHEGSGDSKFAPFVDGEECDLELVLRGG